MNDWMALGILCGAVVGLLIVVILLRLMKTDGSSKCKFDERQELVRGRGFKYAFFTLMIYSMVYGYMDMFLAEKKIDTMTGTMIGVMLGIVVYAVYSIWNEGYFSLNEDPKRVIIIFAIIAVVNFMLAGMNIADGKMIEDGVLTFRSMNLFCGIMFVIIGGVLMLKKALNAKEDE